MRTIKEWCEYIKDWRYKKGFFTPNKISGVNGDFMLGKLMLVTTEIAEAAEAVRSNNEVNFEEELADAIIRIFDICGTMNINLEEVLETKMEYNEQRKLRHGRQTKL